MVQEVKVRPSNLKGKMHLRGGSSVVTHDNVEDCGDEGDPDDDLRTISLIQSRCSMTFV